MTERQGYRENIELLTRANPGKMFFTVEEVATVMSVDRRTVLKLIKRRNSPLRAVNVGAGKYNVWRVSIQSLADFLATKGG